MNINNFINRINKSHAGHIMATGNFRILVTSVLNNVASFYECDDLGTPVMTGANKGTAEWILKTFTDEGPFRRKDGDWTVLNKKGSLRMMGYSNHSIPKDIQKLYPVVGIPLASCLTDKEWFVTLDGCIIHRTTPPNKEMSLDDLSMYCERLLSNLEDHLDEKLGVLITHNALGWGESGVIIVSLEPPTEAMSLSFRRAFGSRTKSHPVVSQSLT